MPLAKGTPTEEFGPDSDTLRPTFRSPACALATHQAASAAANAPRVQVCIRRCFMSWLRWGGGGGGCGSGVVLCCGAGGVVGWWAGGSNEQLDRRQCAPGAEQIDALGADRPTGGRAHQVVARRAAQQGLLLAARLDVEERRAQPCLAV